MRVLQVLVITLGLCGLFAPRTKSTAQGTDREQIQAHYQRAISDLQANRLSSAESEFRAVLRVAPHYAKAYGGLGVVAYQKRDYRQAETSFQAALKLDPFLWNARAFLGMCAMQMGESGKAERLLRKALPHITVRKLRDQAAADLIQIYYNTGDIEKAAGVLRLLEKADPHDPEILYDAYRVYTGLAAHALTTLSKVAPHSPRLHEILGQAFMSQDNPAGAIKEYRQALLSNPTLAGLHFELGQAILTQSHSPASLAKAKNEFKLELSVDPINAYAEYEIGEILWWESSRKAALEHFSRAVQLDARFVKAQIMLGEALMAENKPHEALRHLLEAARLDPANESVHYQLAIIYSKLGQKQDAIRERSIFEKVRQEQKSVPSLDPGVAADPPSM